MTAVKDPFTKIAPRLQSFEPGRQILGQYRIRARLGIGVHGVAYLARDRFIHTDRVLKFPLNLESAREMAWLAHKMVRLSHPFIVQHFGVGQMMISGFSLPFLITEYVEGPSLAEFLADHGRQRVGLFEALRYFADIAQAIGFAHSRGYAHGDVHRDNVLLATGKLAKTRRYVAKLNDFFPTSRRELRSARRADVRETGLLLYEMLTRRHKFQVAALGSQPSEICDLIRRCVSSRTRRFTDGRQLVQALKALQWVD
jgi:serine/threonine protein kinase